MTSQVSLAGDVATLAKMANCSFDRASVLALNEKDFDQDFQGGWRSIAHQDGCKVIAADLIRDYIAEHHIQSIMLFFHEAQLRAMAGQNDIALQLFLQSRKPTYEPDIIGWNHYVDATIAFISKDRSALLRAKAALVKTSKPDDFNPVDVNGNPVDLIWPPNLNVVDGFISCFGQDYELAYSECSGPLLKTDVNGK